MIDKTILEDGTCVYKYELKYTKKDGTISTIYKNVKHKPIQPRWSDEAILNMKIMNNSGIKKHRICSEFNICYSTLSKILNS